MPNTNQSCRISFKLLSDPFTIFAELRNYALDLNQIPARHSIKVELIAPALLIYPCRSGLSIGCSHAFRSFPLRLAPHRGAGAAIGVARERQHRRQHRQAYAADDG